MTYKFFLNTGTGGAAAVIHFDMRNYFVAAGMKAVIKRNIVGESILEVVTSGTGEFLERILQTCTYSAEFMSEQDALVFKLAYGNYISESEIYYDVNSYQLMNKKFI